MAKAKEIGIDAYLAEQRTKKAILTRFLNDYDDGTKDVFFCLAVNMLEVKDLQVILSRMDSQSGDRSLQDKATQLERQLRNCAAGKNIPLELRPW
jgi:hypothetical protein